MNIIKLPPISEFGVNSYIIVTEDNKGVLVDAPGNGREIMKAAEKNNIALTDILLTHGHCDHISACAYVQRETGARVHISEYDVKKLTNQNTNLTAYFALPPIDPPDLPDPLTGDITLNGIKIRVINTPGHTRGSVCYIIDDNMFCGDTLFKGSMGRTDMPDGDEKAMLSTLAMLYDFEPETDYKLFPGHGRLTSMSAERKNNRYMIYAHKV
ncbi:MAG: MBL fold metallo-hydrolase [Ruminococcus sp.]|nr:MBL fold metallo-hydrolase [Ruminococcus sp.]